ncbi:hypothetical protein CLOP_g22511, partial [Closterium sp. NIES-67]
LFPGHVSASFSCVRVPAADGICDGDVTDPDSSGTAVSEGEVGLVAVYGAVDGGLLGDYKVSISGHPYALVQQGIMGVSPSVPGATPEQVVGQPGVEDFEFLGAVASAGGWEWKAEAEGQGNGEVSSRARGGIAVSHFASQVCKWVGLVKGGVRCRTASARGPPDAAGRAAKRPWAWVRLTQSSKRGREGRLSPSAHPLHLASGWLEVAGTQEGMEELPTPVGPDVQGKEVKGGGAD